MTDTERLDWLQEEIRNGTIADFQLHGQAWIRFFTVSSQFVGPKETIREVIDLAIEKAKKA